MKTLLSIKNLTLSNIFYYIQGNINWFFFRKYIKRYNNRVKKCIECATIGSCIYCGCDFDSMAVSTKKCKQWKG